MHAFCSDPDFDCNNYFLRYSLLFANTLFLINGCVRVRASATKRWMFKLVDLIWKLKLFALKIACIRACTFCIRIVWMGVKCYDNYFMEQQQWNKLGKICKKCWYFQTDNDGKLLNRGQCNVLFFGALFWQALHRNDPVFFPIMQSEIDCIKWQTKC